LEESETPSPLPEGSIPEAAEVETVPAVEEREFPIAIEEAKAVEVALEVEEKRKAKSKVFYKRKKQFIQLRLKATKRVDEQLSPLQETLGPITYTS
jgi:hypothetical protein